MTLPEVRPTNPIGAAESAAKAATGAASGAAGGIKGALGSGGTAEQFLIWNVLSQIVGAALTPAISDIIQGVNSADAVNPLTPQELAIAVVREIIDPGNGTSEAAKSGIGAGRFQELVDIAKSPPSLGLVLAAYQRQAGTGGPVESRLVDIDKALADLGIADKYWPMVKGLAIQIPTAAEVLNAWLEGQIEEPEARARILATGMDPDWITTAYNANGQAPTPNELLDLWNRGIIVESGTGPESTSYEQGFLEGPWRNKWLPAFKELRNYIPPPRTTQAMLREGTITEAQATLWLNHYGVFGETLAAFLSHSSPATTPDQRELSRTDVVDLYESQLIDATQATDDLHNLGYTLDDARLILTLADKKQATAATKSAVTRLKNLYLAGSNDLAATRTALSGIGIADAQVNNLLATWQLEQATAVERLSAAQIVSAWYYNLFSDDPATNTQTALSRLVAHGYSLEDATILLEIRVKGKLQ